MDEVVARRFAALQAELGPAYLANQAESKTDHVLVLLPSYSAAESLLAHYGPRVAALEHRYLVAYLLFQRIPHCEIVYLCSRAPDPAVLDYYDRLLGPCDPQAPRRFQSVVVDDGTPRSVSAKLLDRPDLLDEIRAACTGRLAFVHPWNVTDLEVSVALQLGIPVLGTSPELWPLAFKSAGRRVMSHARVPVPYGTEDASSVEDVLSALQDIQRVRPGATGAVVKLDDSGAGDGNMVISLRDASGAAATPGELRQRVESLPAWYLSDLRDGGVVEELITAASCRSPSVQLNISPFGEVTVLSTHEQVLGGDSGQVFKGCRFPADPQYAQLIADYGKAIGEAFAARGALGRMGVDFVVGEASGSRWKAWALEVNLRNGGTTHPFAVLRNLAPGRYDVDTGQWLTADGTPRAYVATDNMVERAWLGLPPQAVIDAVAAAGLEFDRVSATGIVLHMLSCLAVDGRFGLIAVGRTPEHAAELLDATQDALDELVGQPFSTPPAVDAPPTLAANQRR